MIDRKLVSRVSDRISFLYVEKAKIVKSNNTLCIENHIGKYLIPAGMILTLFLGPGTSITHDAISYISESGMCIVWTGTKENKTYAYGECLNHSSKPIYTQAKYVTNKRKHLEIARKMYQMRFPNDDFTGLSIAKMRGKEGTRMRQIYSKYAKQFNIPWYGRNYDPKTYNASDLPNQILTTANQILYGICTAAIVALGFSPALGFIHVGLDKSFVYDISDLYKADNTIPMSFKLASEFNNISGVDTTSSTFQSAIRKSLQDQICTKKLLTNIVHDLFELFNISEPQINILYLWDNIDALQTSGIQYEEIR